MLCIKTSRMRRQSSAATQNPTSFAILGGDYFILCRSSDIGELTRTRNQPSHRQVGGSHHAVAAHRKSAAPDPISHAGKLYAALPSSDGEN